jgi:uncharacterized protein YebE (UPF0316 family)
VRIIFVARGRKYLAPILGFFEITIWLFAIGQIMQNLGDIGCYIAFAGGFTVGNFLGVFIEQKLAMGHSVVRIITSKNARRLVDDLKEAGYGVTTLDGMGATGPVQLIFTVVKRKQLGSVVGIIERFDVRTFYSVDDLQSAAQGVFRDAGTSALVSSQLWRVEEGRVMEVAPYAARGSGADAGCSTEWR